MTVGAWAVGACTVDGHVAKQRYVTSGDRYAAADKHLEAILEYRNALQRDPNAGEVRLKLADALLLTGQLADALKEYARAADLLPDVKLQLKTATLLLLAGRFDDAKARAEKALALDPQNVDAQILVANALAGLKDLDAALAQIEDALRLDPARGGTYSNLGTLELSRGKRDAAERAFKRAVELQPCLAAAHVALAHFYWLTGRETAADYSFRQALEIDPQDALINRAVAGFYLTTNRRQAAEAPLKTVFEVTKAPAAAFALADYYLASGRDAAARALLQPMLQDPKTSNEANARLAAIDYRDGRRDEAYQRLAAVLTKNPADLQALIVKSELLVEDGRPSDALAIARTAADRHPDSASAFFMLGRVQAASNQPEAAIVAFQEVLRLNPRATEAKIALAKLHLAKAQPDISIKFSQDALGNEPESGDARLLLARGLLGRGELDRAEAELEQLVTRFPDSAAVHTQMGMLLGRKQKPAAARVEFERALQLQPADLEAFGGLVALDLATRNYAGARARVDARLNSNRTPPLLTVAARVYEESGDLAAAERFLREALELDSAFVAAYGALGELYVAQGRLDAAKSEFEALAARSQKPVGALTMLGMILLAQGDVNAARDRFERVIQIDPEAAVAANNLASIYSETGGNLDIALQLALTAKRHLPEVPQVNHTLGFIYYKKDVPSLAVSTLKLSAEKARTMPSTSITLAWPTPKPVRGSERGSR